MKKLFFIILTMFFSFTYAADVFAASENGATPGHDIYNPLSITIALVLITIVAFLVIRYMNKE